MAVTRIFQVKNFYPRPPRGGRLTGCFFMAFPPHISIHALREEGDQSQLSGSGHVNVFLSTPSARRATFFFPLCYSRGAFLSTPSARRATDGPCIGGTDAYISIHALREEGDLTIKNTRPKYGEFLSTPSARRATDRFGFSCGYVEFLSTPSARRATFTGCSPKLAN